MLDSWSKVNPLSQLCVICIYLSECNVEMKQEKNVILNLTLFMLRLITEFRIFAVIFRFSRRCRTRTLFIFIFLVRVSSCSLKL